MKIQIEEADLRSVLTALEEIHPGNMTPMAEEAWNKAITAIREALAEQPAQQEPVAWITKNGKGWLRWHKPEDSEKNKDSIPLYTSQPASKPWVGLTNQELIDLTAIYSGAPLYCAIEAKLKEKNT